MGRSGGSVSAKGAPRGVCEPKRGAAARGVARFRRRCATQLPAPVLQYENVGNRRILLDARVGEQISQHPTNGAHPAARWSMRGALIRSAEAGGGRMLCVVSHYARKLQDDLAYPPRAMRADRAAAYFSMSRSAFLQLVAQRLMPRPARVGGMVLWDRLALDVAFDELKAVEEEEGPNSFDLVLEKRKT